MRRLSSGHPSPPQTLGGGFEEFVGGPSKTHLIFPTLLHFCSIDETTVRQQSVDSINQLCRLSSPDMVADHLAGRVLRLMETNDWFTPRVSGVGLAATTYSLCVKSSRDNINVTRGNGDPQTMTASELARELAEAFRKLCLDTSEPMVRRTAALRMRDAAAAFGPDRTRDDLGDAYIRLIGESEQESIRVNALKSSPAIFSVATLTDANGEAFLACHSDKSWRVRVAVAETLASVAKSIKGFVDKAAWAEQLEIAQRTFIQLMEDQEAEVRFATAAQSAAVASVLGADFAKAKIVPMLIQLVTDEGVTTRVDLAGTLLELADPMGAEYAKEVYLGTNGDAPLINILLGDANTNLRLAVITRLTGLIDVITIAQAPKIITQIHELCEDKNWRVRWAAMMLLTDLCQQMTPEEFVAEFIGGEKKAFANCSQDNCALIRTDWVQVCLNVAEVYGKGWLVEQIVPIVEKCDEQKAYQVKAVLLDAAAAWGSYLSGTSVLESKLLPKAILMLEDRVPNLALLTAQSIGTLLKNKCISHDYVSSSLKPVLTKVAVRAVPACTEPTRLAWRERMSAETHPAFVLAGDRHRRGRQNANPGGADTLLAAEALQLRP